MTTLTANMKERIDDSTLEHVREQISGTETKPQMPESTAPRPDSKVMQALEMVAKRLGYKQLFTFARRRGRVAEACGELPKRMHVVAKQTQLILELVDDFRSGVYRRVPWHSVAIGLGAILYAASPADVLPDALLGVGALDDIAVVAIAARMLRKDLMTYCEFKGYPVEQYFMPSA